MKIFGLPWSMYLLITSGESYLLTTSTNLRQRLRRNVRLQCALSDPQQGVRRAFLSQTVLVGFNFLVGIQSTSAAGTSTVESVMPSSKNKKLGGLAFKIQSVGHVMVSHKLSTVGCKFLKFRSVG
jgi:hypothetical protein